ncbi:hypothetical protein [Streptococcus sanguinis]|uniref:Lacal_2735 family protein n=1 Tax=Streptococcus sanguinis TaxID=1305 RepID=A0ABD4VKL1_STRSA|nr:hypothetical protein [Streptococcus sanguinis]MCY7035294.1 hypothetical protein [Streptococcus sanguinis]
MFSFFTRIKQNQQDIKQSKKEMKLRHKEFSNKIHRDIQAGEEGLALKSEIFNQRYGHLFNPRNK